MTNYNIKINFNLVDKHFIIFWFVINYSTSEINPFNSFTDKPRKPYKYDIFYFILYIHCRKCIKLNHEIYNFSLTYSSFKYSTLGIRETLYLTSNGNFFLKNSLIINNYLKFVNKIITENENNNIL